MRPTYVNDQDRARHRALRREGKHQVSAEWRTAEDRDYAMAWWRRWGWRCRAVGLRFVIRPEGLNA